MKKLLLGGLLALVAVSANAQINSIEDKKAIDTAKQIITDNLKDPNSANFRDINVYHLTNKNTNETKISAVCGEVNARNSYGGYAGFKKFVAVMLGDKPQVAVEDGKPALYPMLKAFCQE